MTATSTINTNLELKSDRMIKRSQNKKFFSRDNYKVRLFVLTPVSLRYYESTEEHHRGKLKGTIYLALIKTVEFVDDGALEDKTCVFQIVYKEDAYNTQFTLYIIAQTDLQRKEWVELIRTNALARNGRFFPQHHSGVWCKPGRFSCCESIDKRSAGCRRSGQSSMPAALLLAADEENLSPQTNNGGSVAAAAAVPLAAGVAMNGHDVVPVVGGDESLRMVMIAAGGDNKSQQQDATTVDNIVVAVHNYKPIHRNQLKLEKGEKYLVLDKSNLKWWYCRAENGHCGYVPTNFIQKPNSLQTYDWYYKNISRQRAETLLLEEGRREGCFLVRDSVSKRNTFSLSVLAKDPTKNEWRVHHYHIHQNSDGLYFLAEQHARSSIPELIYYHKHHSGGLVVRLRSPPNVDHDCPVTAGLGLDEFELDPKELKLDREPIGRGQFGEVKRGVYRGHIVAVKQMLEGTMNEDDFIAEARNMRNLNHPNLVQLYGVVTKSRPIMILTEYMRHGSLKDYLRKQKVHYLKRARIPALIDVCQQVCAAMSYLETQQFIHRDLACRNCLVKSVSQQRGTMEVKVCDFGMARFMVDQEYDASAGTKFPVRWAAPEVFQSNKYSSKSDGWSFSVLMWEVFTACDTPYEGKSNAEVCEYVTDGGMLVKPALCPEQYVYVFIMLECWKMNPTERPTFAELLTKFEYLDKEGVENLR